MAASVVCLMGPTASGKTALAYQLVDEFPFDIISVDSAMIYRGLDIGTAKPPPFELRRYPHRLIDIRDPSEAYSAAQFRDDALKLIEQIHATGRIPLLVGGTGLYFRVLNDGVAELPAADAEVRERLNQALAEQGSLALHQRLEAIDPARAAQIHPNDPQRILRALEVFEITGQPMSRYFQRSEPMRLPYTVLKIALTPADRGWLHGRIERRFREMLEYGFVNEVAALMQRPGVGEDSPAMRSVGYRAVWQYLEGRYGFDDMARRGIASTRQLAKRQITWFRAETEVVRFDPQSRQIGDELRDAVQRHLSAETL